MTKQEALARAAEILKEVEKISEEMQNFIKYNEIKELDLDKHFMLSMLRPYKLQCVTLYWSESTAECNGSSIYRKGG